MTTRMINDYQKEIKDINSELNCYLLDKRRYLVFWDELIKKRL